MCFNEIHICLCLWENRGTKKFIRSLSLELVNVGGFDIPLPCDGLWNSRLFLKQLLVDTEFDMAVSLNVNMRLSHSKMELPLWSGVISFQPF
jgi:hypothetical protein